ncbi:8478_t:CDS:2, partial [Funneliformis caledonium]
TYIKNNKPMTVPTTSRPRSPICKASANDRAKSENYLLAFKVQSVHSEILLGGFLVSFSWI